MALNRVHIVVRDVLEMGSRPGQFMGGGDPRTQGAGKHGEFNLSYIEPESEFGSVVKNETTG